MKHLPEMQGSDTYGCGFPLHNIHHTWYNGRKVSFLKRLPTKCLREANYLVNSGRLFGLISDLITVIDSTQATSSSHVRASLFLVEWNVADKYRIERFILLDKFTTKQNVLSNKIWS